MSLLVLTAAAACAFAAPQPIDPSAEPETRALLMNLHALAGTRILFGHHDTTAYGVGWRGDADRSDVKSVTGAYPALYGWDFLGFVDHDARKHAERRQELVAEAYARGGLNTFCWHMNNPVSGENFYDLTPAVAAILPGGAHHGEYKERLDRIAAFAHGLEGKDGGHVPIIFRPFHEHTGDWFWWGTAHCSRAEFVALWRFTVRYLRDRKGVHNFLYAYSPNIDYGGAAGRGYMDRYPGDDYVDILGFDAYVPNFRGALPAVREVVTLARARGKVAALTEVGYPDGLSRTDAADWYTRALLQPIVNDPVAREVAFLMVWRNAHDDHFWVPYPGHPAVDDFRAFKQHPRIVFGDTLPDLYTTP